MSTRRTCAAALTAALTLGLPLTASAAEPDPDFALDYFFEDGTTGTVPLGRVLFGDVDADGDGDDEPGQTPVVYDGEGGWLFFDDDVSSLIGFGRAGDLPLLGDWDGDGDDEMGVLRGNVYYLASENVDGGGDVRRFAFARPSDDVATLTGDWDGDGDDEPAVLREAGRTVRVFFAGATADGGGDVFSQTWGRSTTDLFFPADLDGDGTDSLVIERFAAAQGGPGRAPYFFVSSAAPRDGLGTDAVRRYGRPLDGGVAADVDDDGSDELGVARLVDLSDGQAAADSPENRRTLAEALGQASS